MFGILRTVFSKIYGRVAFWHLLSHKKWKKKQLIFAYNNVIFRTVKRIRTIEYSKREILDLTAWLEWRPRSFNTKHKTCGTQNTSIATHFVLLEILNIALELQFDIHARTHAQTSKFTKTELAAPLQYACVQFFDNDLLQIFGTFLFS